MKTAIIASVAIALSALSVASGHEYDVTLEPAASVLLTPRVRVVNDRDQQFEIWYRETGSTESLRLGSASANATTSYPLPVSVGSLELRRTNREDVQSYESETIAVGPNVDITLTVGTQVENSATRVEDIRTHRRGPQLRAPVDARS